MRSSAEIKAEIDALTAQMADGIPYGDSAARNVGIYDHILSGDHSGIDAYNRAVEQAIQNKLQRELTESEGDKNRENAFKIAEMSKLQAAEERQAKEDELKALKAAQARPEYMKLQKQMLDAVDNGNLEEAAIYKEQMAVLEKEHGMDFGKSADKLIAARQAGNETKKKKDFIAQVLASDSPSDEDLAEAMANAKGLEDTSSVTKLTNKRNSLDLGKADAALAAAIAAGDPDAIEAAASAYDELNKIKGYEGKKSNEARTKATTIRKNRVWVKNGHKALDSVTIHDILAADSSQETKGKVHKGGYTFEYKWLPGNNGVDRASITWKGKTKVFDLL